MKFFQRMHTALRLTLRGYMLLPIAIITCIYCLYYIFLVFSLDHILKQTESQTNALDAQQLFTNMGARIGWCLDIALAVFFLVVFVYVSSNIAVIFYRSHKRYTSYGSAHLASVKELLEARLCDNVLEPRLWLGKVGRYRIGLTDEQQQAHVLCVGETDASTHAIMEPALTSGETGLRSLLFVDTDGQLVAKTDHLKHWATLYRLDFHQPTFCYNPLQSIHSVEDAKNFSVCWLANTEGTNEHLAALHLLLTATVIHLVHTEPQAPLSRLADLLSTTTIATLRSLLIESRSTDARTIATTFFNAHDPAAAGTILAELALRFLLLREPEVRAITEKNTVPIGTLNEQRSVFILSLYTVDRHKYAPLIACFLMQLAHSLQQQPQPRPFALYLPQLATVGYIPHLGEILKGPGLVFIAGVDQLGQLWDLYGPEDARQIRDQIGTHVLFRGCQDGEYYRKRIGTRTVLKPSRRADRRSFWRRLIEGPYVVERGEYLFTAEQIRLLPEDEILIVRRDAPLVKACTLT